MREHMLELWGRNKAKATGLLALVVATGMMLAVVPAANADTATTTYDTADEFLGGDAPDKAGKLTLTKVLTKAAGKKSTGSVRDAPTSPKLGAGVTFVLTRVTPKAGRTPGSMDPKTDSYVRTGTVYKGKTDAQGLITNGDSSSVGDGFWRDSAGNIIPGFPVDSANHSSYYYLLEESDMDNPYTRPDNPLFNPAYTKAEPSIFDLPYRATNVTTNRDAAGTVTSTSSEDGFVYNLHIYPKNVNESQIAKDAVKVTAPDGTARPGNLAQVGDTVTWKVTQKLYDDTRAGGMNGDGRIQLSEIRDGGRPGLFMKATDRVPAALTYVNQPPHLDLSWTEDGTQHTEDITTGGYVTIDPRPGSDGNVNKRSDSLQGTAMTTGPVKDMLTFPDLEKNSTVLTVKWYSNWNGRGLGELAGHYDAAKTYTDIKLELTYDTKVSGSDDGEASPMGLLTNAIASDNADNATHDPYYATASVPTAGLQFAKTNKKDQKDTTLKGLAGAVFRLTPVGDKTRFLGSDGKFYAEGATLPSGVTALEATSNSKGVVSFVGVPIVDSATGKVYADRNKLQFGLLEVTKPKYDPTGGTSPTTDYRAPSIAFGTVDFSKYQSAEPGTLTEGAGADIAKLDFKDYATKNMPTGDTSPFKNMRGDVIGKGLVNWRQDQEDPAKVGALPLTGGQGILFMLIVGLLVMFAGLAASKYRERRQSHAIHRA
ncbi:isopeptide-forming domain-containing protein [Bifidobacterium xylocopae]|uniref:Gram-positive cocci surface proteins LPxTG domain-containing protein n=1 Tax=Bifidobacterium xylocopae TaxID=2493119 RepID=A0A366KCX7_9BIFI|nr:hypothetical protein [Bifidobacterium xylocopae]RBP99605.1 hypothetical protein CRD59_02380 [Bifidobacterium xylocopae]